MIQLSLSRRKKILFIGLFLLALPILAFAILWLATPSPLPQLTTDAAKSIIIEDANGTVLFHSASDMGGRQRWLPLREISPHLINATLAAEDHRFYEHGGVDPLGIVRAAWLNLQNTQTLYGGSTISMQLARLLNPQSCTRTIPGKLRQAFWALKIESALTKAQILEQYFNRAYYGNKALGAGEAASLYFGKSQSTLSPGEAALLAVLPRGPEYYDPYTYSGHERAFTRQKRILDRMTELGLLTGETKSLALDLAPKIQKHESPRKAPHFVDYILSRVPDEKLRKGPIQTTLDYKLQERMEVAVKRHIAQVGGRGANQAGVVIVRNRDGAILSMVGSRSYYEWATDGAANVVTLKRRPGSTLKPFVYALAMERGDSPATVAYDVILDGEAHESYAREVKQHGPARYRESLAGSYNLAAVHTLQKVGVGTLLSKLRSAGLTTLDRDNSQYDALLAVGEAEFTVLEYTGAFAAFGNSGLPVAPRAIERNFLRRSSIFSPQIAYQIFDILSDPDARRPMFGDQSPMVLPFKVALKTGTTRAYTDNLAFGTTVEYTVGAWAGNFDGTPTQTLMAMQGAAPLIRAAFVNLAALYGDPTSPKKPKEIKTAQVCPMSGKAPSPLCPARKIEIFVPGQALPNASDVCDWHVHQCGKSYVNFPQEVKGWARAHGLVKELDCHVEEDKTLQIVFPENESLFLLEAHRSKEHQIPPLQALPNSGATQWFVNGQALSEWTPAPGRHTIEARLGNQTDSIVIEMR